jgi:hypothetical protein
MAYASQSGRARTNPRRPEAHAICDRCGFRWNHSALRWQYDYRGPIVANLRILVCPTCLDGVNSQLRAITLPVDPEPITNARVQDFDAAETDYRALTAPTVIDPVTGIPIPGTTLRVTEDGQNRVTTPFGNPVGLSQNAVMPYNGAVQRAYGVALQLLSVTADGSPTVQVTCSAPHGLGLNGQIAVEGLANTAACGFYSVTVLSAMAFTYMTYGSITAGPLLTPTTRMITALVGLPRGFTRIPKIQGPPLLGGIAFATNAIELETDANASFLLEDGLTFIELEDGP